MFCFAGTCMSVLFLEAAGCWNPQETCSVWNAERIHDFSRFPPFCLFFFASPISFWWSSLPAEDQTCLQSFVVLHLLSGWEPECWGPIFSRQSNMPGTECKLHSLLRAWSVFISRLDPCFSLAYKFIPASSNWIPSLMLREYATGRRRHVDFTVTEELTRNVLLSSLQPFLREETKRFLRLRRAVF